MGAGPVILMRRAKAITVAGQVNHLPISRCVADMSVERDTFKRGFQVRGGFSAAFDNCPFLA